MSKFHLSYKIKEIINVFLDLNKDMSTDILDTWGPMDENLLDELNQEIENLPKLFTNSGGERKGFEVYAVCHKIEGWIAEHFKKDDLKDYKSWDVIIKNMITITYDEWKNEYNCEAEKVRNKIKDKLKEHYDLKYWNDNVGTNENPDIVKKVDAIKLVELFYSNKQYKSKNDETKIISAYDAAIELRDKLEQERHNN
jgi:hypothetical protein